MKPFISSMWPSSSVTTIIRPSMLVMFRAFKLCSFPIAMASFSISSHFSFIPFTASVFSAMSAAMQDTARLPVLKQKR